MSDSWRDLRDRLDALGFRPSKRLGQNFLIDRALATAIADQLGYETDPLIVEVGAGPGSLTRELVGKGDVLAFEIDSRLASFLRAESHDFHGAARFELVEADVLDRGELAPSFTSALERRIEGHDDWVCVSNLPYSSAGPFLAAVLQAERPPSAVVVLTQWEFGERVTARPGTAEFGSLSVQAQLAFEPRLVRRVHPEVFRPRPRVDSALVELVHPKCFLGRPAPQRRAFGRFVQALFGARRKVLRHGLERWSLERGGVGRVRSGDVVAHLAQAGIDESVLRERPDALEPARFLQIFDALEGTA
ncbi:MAG: ribosomal RNA small subunit methyltransferase A [Planctomycetes bacterium]|nr:ribosomal RNA small subunit methyltransferase A [Planctomycetota bacterium]